MDLDQVWVAARGTPQDQPASVADLDRHTPGVGTVPKLAQPPAAWAFKQFGEDFLNREVERALWLLALRQVGFPGLDAHRLRHADQVALRAEAALHRR